MTLPVGAVDQPKPQPQVKTEQKLPQLSDRAKLRIRDAQVNLMSIQPQFQAANQALAEAVQEAFKEAGLSQKDYILKPDLTFEKLPTPAEKK